MSFGGYPHQANLLFAIPFSGRPLPPEILLSFHQVAPPMNYNTLMLNTHKMPVDVARQGFAEAAIEHNCKYLFFWDEDVIMPALALRELIFTAEHHPDAAVVAGIYCLKTDRPEPLVFKGLGNGPYWDWRVGEVFECTALGMGCTLIRTDVFKDLEKPWFKSVSDLTPYLDNIPFGEVWTEDLYFCKKVTDTKKWKLLAHGQILCKHVSLDTGKVYELPPDSKPMRHLAVPKGNLKILDIGAGGNKLKTDEGGVISVDIRGETEPDYRCDFRRLPFASGEFDVVYSSHTLEHVSRGEVGDVLDEWIRVLKPKGEFRIIVPDLAWAAAEILKGNVDKNVMNVLYGQQEYKENYHRTGFTAAVLQELLKKRGFKRQEMRTEGYNIIIRAWRQNGVGRHARRAGNAGGKSKRG